MSNIVVVESKDKIQSVSKYLGDGYFAPHTGAWIETSVIP